MIAVPPALFPGGGQGRVAERVRQAVDHFLGTDLPETALLHVPVFEQANGVARTGLCPMLGDQAVQQAASIGAVDTLKDHRVRVYALAHLGLGHEDEGHAAGHAGGEIIAHRA